MQDDGYYVGYYSVFDDKKDIKFTRYDSRTDLLEPLADTWGVKRLQWFSHGFYRVSQPSPCEVVITDLRMGVEDGCIAVTNQVIEAIWAMVAGGTPIEIADQDQGE